MSLAGRVENLRELLSLAPATLDIRGTQRNSAGNANDNDRFRFRIVLPVVARRSGLLQRFFEAQQQRDRAANKAQDSRERVVSVDVPFPDDFHAVYVYLMLGDDCLGSLDATSLARAISNLEYLRCEAFLASLAASLSRTWRERLLIRRTLSANAFADMSGTQAFGTASKAASSKGVGSRTTPQEQPVDSIFGIAGDTQPRATPDETCLAGSPSEAKHHGLSLGGVFPPDIPVEFMNRMAHELRGDPYECMSLLLAWGDHVSVRETEERIKKCAPAHALALSFDELLALRRLHPNSSRALDAFLSASHILDLSLSAQLAYQGTVPVAQAGQSVPSSSRTSSDKNTSISPTIATRPTQSAPAFQGVAPQKTDSTASEVLQPTGVSHAQLSAAPSIPSARDLNIAPAPTTQSGTVLQRPPALDSQQTVAETFAAVAPSSNASTSSTHSGVPVDFPTLPASMPSSKPQGPFTPGCATKLDRSLASPGYVLPSPHHSQHVHSTLAGGSNKSPQLALGGSGSAASVRNIEPYAPARLAHLPTFSRDVSVASLASNFSVHSAPAKPLCMQSRTTNTGPISSLASRNPELLSSAPETPTKSSTAAETAKSESHLSEDHKAIGEFTRSGTYICSVDADPPSASGSS